MRAMKSLLTVPIILLLTYAALGDSPASAADPVGTLPATFAGELPCADCPGIDYNLSLFDDKAFYLRMSYRDRGEGAVSDDIGSWSTDPEGTTLALWGGGEAPILWRIVNADTLRLLDREGNDIESSLNYELQRIGELSDIEPKVSMRGTYTYMADAALFTECLTGRRMPVAMEADNLALEQAYLEAQRRPGDHLLVSFEGHIAQRPPMEGEGMRSTVIVDEFLGVWPAETCGARISTSDLFDTRWEPTRFGNEPVIMAENQRSPFLMLNLQSHQVRGFGGCNRFGGSFEIEGRSIAFGPMAKTAMACIHGGDTEETFLAALEEATTWRHLRHHLEFYDKNGDLLLRLEARHFD